MHDALLLYWQFHVCIVPAFIAWVVQLAAKKREPNSVTTEGAVAKLFTLRERNKRVDVRSMNVALAGAMGLLVFKRKRYRLGREAYFETYTHYTRLILYINKITLIKYLRLTIFLFQFSTY